MELLNDCVSGENEHLYLNEDYADVHFSFKKNGNVEKLPAHKVILAVQSGVFNKMFQSKPKGDIKIPDTTFGDFKEILKFFYLRKVNMSIPTVRVRRLAERYGILDRFDNSNNRRLNNFMIRVAGGRMTIEDKMRMISIVLLLLPLIYFKIYGPPIFPWYFLITYIAFAMSYIEVRNRSLISHIENFAKKIKIDRNYTITYYPD